jgi:predicted N-acetyltransferase YhbS
VKITTRPAQPRDAELFVELAARAFAHVPEHARPKERPEFVAHTHGAQNPAGSGLVTLAEEDGRVLGHVGAIPFRFLRRDGTQTTGWQIGCYVVDGTQQRKGIGQAILSDLQLGVAREPRGGFLFGYPNRRSLGPLLKLGGREVARARTLLLRPRETRRVRDAQGRDWVVKEVDAEEAGTALGHQRFGEPARGAFVRDAAFFRWRYLAPAAAPRYRFALSAPEGGGDSLLLVFTRHHLGRLLFTVFVDAVPDLTSERLALALKATRIAGGGRPVYVTTNLRWTGSPRALALPERFDPRPVVDVLMPGCDEIAPELAEAPILTGDWMGF